MRFIQATRTWNLTNEPHQGLHSFDEIAEHLLWVPYRCEPRRPMSSARVSQEEYDIAKHGWRVQPSPAQGIEEKATRVSMKQRSRDRENKTFETVEYRAGMTRKLLVVKHLVT